jgi:hypothetical protein
MIKKREKSRAREIWMQSAVMTCTGVRRVKTIV